MIEHTKCNLSGSKFDDVNLQGTLFNNINLSESTFTDINLTGTQVENVNASNVTFHCVKFEGAAIDRCLLDGMTIDGVLVTDLIAAYKKMVSEQIADH